MSLPNHLPEFGTFGLMTLTVVSVVWRATRDEPLVRTPAPDASPLRERSSAVAALPTAEASAA